MRMFERLVTNEGASVQIFFSFYIKGLALKNRLGLIGTTPLPAKSGILKVKDDQRHM